MREYRCERVELKQQNAVGGESGSALPEGGPLVRGVHDPEAVHRKRRSLPGGNNFVAPIGEQRQPGAAMRTTELGDGPAGEPTGIGDLPDGAGGLVAQCLRLDTARFVRDGVVVDELGEATVAAHGHCQRVRRLGGGDRGTVRREMVCCGHHAEIENSLEARSAAAATGCHVGTSRRRFGHRPGTRCATID